MTDELKFHGDPGGDEALKGLEAALDDLASRERANAPASLEARIILASSGSLRASATAAGAPGPIRVRRLARWAAAAAVALVAGGALWMSWPGAPQPAALNGEVAADLDRWLEVSEEWPSTSVQTVDEIEEAFAALDRSYEDLWPSFESEASIFEESM